MRSVPLLLLSFGALLPSPGQGEALAQSSEPLVSDRPDFSESPLTVTRGRWQLEGGYTFARRGAVKGHALGEVLLRIGALEWAEVRVALNSYAWEVDGEGTRRGVEDAFLGAKLGLLRASHEAGGWRPAVALLLGSTLPTGSSILGVDDFQPEAKLALGWGLTSGLVLGSNLNVALASTGRDRYGQFSGSLVLGVGLTGRLGGYLEFFGFRAANPQGADLDFLNGGFTLLASDDLQFDARAGIGFNGRNPDYFIGAGFAWRR